MATLNLSEEELKTDIVCLEARKREIREEIARNEHKLNDRKKRLMKLQAERIGIAINDKVGYMKNGKLATGTVYEIDYGGLDGARFRVYGNRWLHHREILKPQPALS